MLPNVKEKHALLLVVSIYDLDKVIKYKEYLFLKICLVIGHITLSQQYLVVIVVVCEYLLPL